MLFFFLLAQSSVVSTCSTVSKRQIFFSPLSYYSKLIYMHMCVFSIVTGGINGTKIAVMCPSSHDGGFINANYYRHKGFYALTVPI